MTEFRGRGIGRRRLLVSAAAAAAGGAVLGGAGTVGATAPTIAHGRISITFHFYVDSTSGMDVQTRLVENAIRPYMDANPGIDVVAVPEDNPNNGDLAVLSEIIAGAGPDLYYTWHPQTVFGSPAFAADLTPYVKKYNADLTAFNPAQVQQLQQPRGLLGLPYYTNTWAAMVNLGMLDQAGVAYPDPNWDYKEYERLARAVTKHSPTTNIWGGDIGMGGNGTPPDQSFSAPFAPAFVCAGFGGGAYVDPADSARCVADSPATIAANEWAWSLRDDQIWNNGGAFWSFPGNQHAMVPIACFDLPYAATGGYNGVKWDIWQMPAFPHGRGTAGGNDMTALNPNSKHADAAWDFLYWRNWKPDFQRAMMRIYLLTPALNSLWEEWVAVVKATAPPLAHKNIEAFVVSNDYPAFPFQIFAYEASTAYSLFTPWGDKLVNKQVSVREALTQITREVNALEATGPALTRTLVATENADAALIAKAKASAAALTFPAPERVDVGQAPTPAHAKWAVTGAGGSLAVTGLGQGPHNEADAGTYASAPFVVSRGQIQCRLVSLGAVGQNHLTDGAKAALMIRSSLADGAAFVSLDYSVGRGVHLHSRPVPGAPSDDQRDGSSPGLISRSEFTVNTSAPSANYLAKPLWFRLVRNVDEWTAFTSWDGRAWQQAGFPVTLSSTGVWAGVFVDSGTTTLSDGAMRATFDHLSLAPNTYVQIGTP